MLFNSWEFFAFFALVAAVYFVLSHRAQNVFLLVASYAFYSCWDWRFSGLLLLSTVVDFSVARSMESVAKRPRKLLLAVSLGTNLGILGFFKYCGFFVDSAAAALTRLGVDAHAPMLEIVLPVGISFYTFQTMAYAIDVYRGRLRAERDPIVFGIYVSYFPQLVAGPIERASRLLPQLKNPRRVTADQIASGGVLILIGLVRKVVIADVCAGFVDDAFANAESLSLLGLSQTVLYFSLQIYGDFAGYSDIARGTSRILGIELMENFQHPYFATSISDFWRRWHVSLSTWLRDYLYISLGGNRGPRWRMYRNLMLTMLLGGLWHGANWTFVVWGAIHGIALVVNKVWVGRRREPASPAAWRSALGWILTMLVVGFAWLFFRAENLSQAFGILSSALTVSPWSAGFTLPFLPLLQLMILLLLVDVPQRLAMDHTALLRTHWVLRGVVYAAAVLLIALTVSESDVPFIYFQF